MRVRRLTAALSISALIALACGQKPGVHEAAYGTRGAGGGLQGAAADGTALDEFGNPVEEGRAGRGGTASGSSAAAGTAAGGGPSGGTAPNPAADLTGFERDRVIIGLHAPVTGAAPIRSDSFQTGGPLYWQRGNRGKPVTLWGRRVEVLFADDKYNPSTAKTKCQELAESGNAFLLIGGGGTDQIRACAEYAASRGIPYLSAGVTQLGVGGLRNYFAGSMSYPQQIPLLARYVRNELGFRNNRRIVMIATNTTNFDDAVQAFRGSFPGAAVIRSSKSASGTDYADDVCTGATKRYDVVFPLTAPTFFLELEGSAACNPQYVGVGITMGLDTVAANGCRTATGSMNGARFFSPFFAFADTSSRARDFRAAGGRDDIQFAIWGVMKTLHQMFLKVGEDRILQQGRAGFIAGLERARAIRSGVFPELSYSPSDHFGADATHVLRAVCGGSGGNYVTERFFWRG